MGMVCRLILFLASITLFVGTGYGQQEPSLGDLARQQRQQKAQSKATPGKDGRISEPKVITNEQMPSHPETTAAPGTSAGESRNSVSAASGIVPPGEVKLSAEEWSAQIRAQKIQVDSMQRQIDQLKDSIHFAPANCVANCAHWNDRQGEKLQQVERMQAQLDEEKKRLEDMQESARKLGFGSSVYEP